jgi:peptide chain release factor 1
VLTVENLLETADNLGKSDEATLHTGENFGDLERLRQETLQLTGAEDDQTIILRQLIHTKNGNDILEGLVLLEGGLDTTGNVVVLEADNIRLEKIGGGVEGVDGGVDTQLSNLTGQDGGGVQVSEGGGRGRIGQIIGRDVDGLDGGNGTLGGGGNTLLEGSHIGGEGGLVTDGGGNTTEKSRHFRTGLGESENVIDEKQDITSTLITEILSDGKTSQGDQSTGTGRLVHLTIDEGGLRLTTVKLDDTRLNHFVVEIVTLTSTLTDTAEDGETTMGLGDVVNKLHNQDSLSDTSTTEETNLTSSGVGGNQIDDLNTSQKDIIRDTESGVLRGISVDGTLLSSDGSTLIDGITENVNDTTQSGLTDGDGDGGSTVNNSHTTGDTISGVEGNATDEVLSQVRGNLKNEVVLRALNVQSVENIRELSIRELNVDDGSNNLDNLTGEGGRGGSGSLGGSSSLGVLSVSLGHSRAGEEANCRRSNK